MLYIYTNPALTERLSTKFYGTILTVSSNRLTIQHNDTCDKVSTGDQLSIDSSVVNVLAILSRSKTQTILEVTPIPNLSDLVGSRIVSLKLRDPDSVSGPGTNFPTDIRRFYLAADRTDRRYRDIIVRVDRPLPLGLSIDFSTDREDWVPELRLNGLPSALTSKHTFYRRIQISTNDILDISNISYEIVAEEYSAYKE